MFLFSEAALTSSVAFCSLCVSWLSFLLESGVSFSEVKTKYMKRYFVILCCVLAYTVGDPKLLLYPTDSDGNLCGQGDFE